MLSLRMSPAVKRKVNRKGVKMIPSTAKMKGIAEL